MVSLCSSWPPAHRGLPSGLEAYGLEAAPEGEQVSNHNNYMTNLAKKGHL